MRNHKLQLLSGVILILFSTNILLAQKAETFDLVTYVPPKDWVKDASKEDVVTFTTSDDEKGSFCVIGIYQSRESTGDDAVDFETEWENYAATPFQIEARPDLASNPRKDGWSQTSGSAVFDGDGGKTLAVLTVFIGHGRALSVISIFNNDAHASDVEDFINELVLKEPE